MRRMEESARLNMPMEPWAQTPFCLRMALDWVRKNDPLIQWNQPKNWLKKSLKCTILYKDQSVKKECRKTATLGRQYGTMAKRFEGFWSVSDTYFCHPSKKLKFGIVQKLESAMILPEIFGIALFRDAEMMPVSRFVWDNHDILCARMTTGWENCSRTSW